MHLVAGFESQIAAHGAALAVSGAARAGGADVSGAAIARRDTESGMRIGPLQGFDPPPHILAVLDRVIESGSTPVALRPGQTMLVVSSTSPEDVFTTLVDAAALDRRGALWTTIVALDRG